MKITNISLKKIHQLIEHYSRFNPSPLTIKKFIDFGQVKCEKTSFLFLKRELPVRLANIMKELQLLPDKLLNQPSVHLVQSWYLKSFEEILEFETCETPTANDLQSFYDQLLAIRNRHNNVVQEMAEGVIQLKETHLMIDSNMEHSIQYFLNRFYMMRISIRMLIYQHTILFGGVRPVHPRHIGIVDPNCNLYSVVQDAFNNAKFLAEQYYLISPELVVEQHNCLNPGVPISIVYVPSHLYHMLFELFKNSLRAVIETHENENHLPPIKVLLTKGEEDVSIKITDFGGGIKRSLSNDLFNYMYSTAPKPSPSSYNIVPLAGYGFGLPLSKLYAKYFHGDLVLNSFEGHSTDAIIYLKVLSSQAEEYLPVFNKRSSKHYRGGNVSSHDWSSHNLKSKSVYDSKSHFVN